MNMISKTLLISLSILVLGACSSTKEMNSESTELPAPVVEEIVELEVVPVETFTEEELMIQQYGDMILKKVIQFDFDKSIIKPEFTPALLAHAAYLVANPEKMVTIEGHADEKGTPEYNISLGERRAKSVQTYLQINGVGPNQVSVVSYGEEKPVNSEHNDSAWAENRRAVVVY
jgi:peptidoglycan-associated lipoprotein